MAGDLCYCAVYRNDSRKKMTRWHARHKSQILTSHKGRSRSKYHKAVHRGVTTKSNKAENTLKLF